MHNNLDEPFYIYALKGLYAGTKVKHPLLAFFSSVLVFCKVAQRSSSGMGRFDIHIYIFNWYDPDAIEGTNIIWNTAGCVCLHWRCVSERPRAFMLRCHVGGVSFECDFFFVFSVLLG